MLPRNPFETIDDGVRELIEIAPRRRGRCKPGIKLGICGEHGGDPASVAFCNSVGLDYVSCSPFRVPTARLAAAQAELATPVRIDVAFTPGEMPVAAVTIVIDVIRATTTIAHALGQGYSRVLACGDIDRARELRRPAWRTAPCLRVSATACSRRASTSATRRASSHAGPPLGDDARPGDDERHARDRGRRGRRGGRADRQPGEPHRLRAPRRPGSRATANTTCSSSAPESRGVRPRRRLRRGPVRGGAARVARRVGDDRLGPGGGGDRRPRTRRRPRAGGIDERREPARRRPRRGRAALRARERLDVVPRVDDVDADVALITA